MNLQPWHFIAILKQEMIKALAEIATTGLYIQQAPDVVVVVVEYSRYSLSEASRAIQSMILTSSSEGIGSNWVGFYNLDAVKPLLEIPGPLDVRTIVPVDYLDQPTGEGIKKRKPLIEIVSSERFGNPFNWRL